MKGVLKIASPKGPFRQIICLVVSWFSTSNWGKNLRYIHQEDFNRNESAREEV